MLRNGLIISLMLALLAVVCCQTAGAARIDADIVKAALRTAQPEEDGFIDRVFILMNAGVLPRSLVESTFAWARRKAHHRFQYFRRGLIIRARRQGIQL